MDRVCIHCPKWKEKQEYVLMNADTIFDAAFDMRNFEEECAKTCVFEGEKECDTQA